MKAHNWMVTHWKPASAFVYTMICFFDFVVFPSYVGVNRVDLMTLVDQIRGMDAATQQQIIMAASQGFEPFTLRGSGLFHLAFGALLTGAVISNGEKGLVYTDRGAEWRRRKEDSNLDAPEPSADMRGTQSKSDGGYQPKKGSDPGPPPIED